ncbi:MAG: carboxypeptidase-like regulatory domain-containing protein, partial [Gemmatimonadaceae bacterium]
MKGVKVVLGVCTTLVMLQGRVAACQSPTRDAEVTNARSANRTSLVGRLTDGSGQPIVGAAVQLPSLDRVVASDRAGAFVIRNLAASSITVHIRALGFQQVTRQVALRPGEDVRLDLTLEPASVQLASMVITGAARAVDPTTPLDVAALEPEKLKAFATASLGRTLERLPGVSSISTGPMSGNPVLRGMSQGQIR